MFSLSSCMKTKKTAILSLNAGLKSKDLSEFTHRGLRAHDTILTLNPPSMTARNLEGDLLGPGRGRGGRSPGARALLADPLTVGVIPVHQLDTEGDTSTENWRAGVLCGTDLVARPRWPPRGKPGIVAHTLNGGPYMKPGLKPSAVNSGNASTEEQPRQPAYLPNRGPTLRSIWVQDSHPEGTLEGGEI
ncbi:Hypothetical predicted protein [Pelobates cultripes]|uniref:Uncharacterized protein n=1 Tax=Pelobates cultripes TaxID=61616 RepID=A0AAD1TEA7_PELCU|nr:Hypothetical predicted protein [Pelobates cultripes]